MTTDCTDFQLLDNPIWNSLATRHAPFAIGGVLARRYRSDIGPLSGLLEPSHEAWMELAATVPAGDVAVLFLEERVKLPAGWELIREGTLVQMVCPSLPAETPASEKILVLGPEDFPEMVALATLTEPGPFRDQTATLGGFTGIRVDGRLAAMAGQRLSPGSFTEVSAVCTHPDFRGRGFARALVARVAHDIFAVGRTPFLSALATNTGAIRVYEQVGFKLRRTLELAVVRPQAG
jgi:ribosomal protein S18 acetylase RimI-like enzyme